MDFVLKVVTNGTEYGKERVSILVLLDFVLKVLNFLLPTVLIHVSILVLLDFVLKVEVEISIDRIKQCFNPCFIGFCS